MSTSGNALTSHILSPYEDCVFCSFLQHSAICPDNVTASVLTTRGQCVAHMTKEARIHTHLFIVVIVYEMCVQLYVFLLPAPAGNSRKDITFWDLVFFGNLNPLFDYFWRGGNQSEESAEPPQNECATKTTPRCLKKAYTARGKSQCSKKKDILA